MGAVAVPSTMDGVNVGTASRRIAATAAVEAGRTLAGGSASAGTCVTTGGAAGSVLLSTAMLGSFRPGAGAGGAAALAIAHPNVDAPRLMNGRGAPPADPRAWGVSVSGATASAELQGPRGEQPDATHTKATEQPREGWDRSAPLKHAWPGMRDWRNIGAVFSG
jgi:hypothetical protein